MKRLFASCLAFGLAVTGVTAAEAQPRRTDQGEARKEMRAGNVKTLREIERIVVPQIERRGNVEYLTPEWDEVARAYRLKFIDNGKGQVIWVDVDARTARILRISK